MKKNHPIKLESKNFKIAESLRPTWHLTIPTYVMNMTRGYKRTWGLNSSALASISLANGVRSSAEPTPSVARAQHVFANP